MVALPPSLCVASFFTNFFKEEEDMERKRWGIGHRRTAFAGFKERFEKRSELCKKIGYGGPALWVDPLTGTFDRSLLRNNGFYCSLGFWDPGSSGL